MLLGFSFRAKAHVLSSLEIYLSYYHSLTLLCIWHRGMSLLSSFKYLGYL